MTSPTALVGICGLTNSGSQNGVRGPVETNAGKNLDKRTLFVAAPGR